MKTHIDVYNNTITYDEDWSFVPSSLYYNNNYNINNLLFNYTINSDFTTYIKNKIIQFKQLQYDTVWHKQFYLDKYNYYKQGTIGIKLITHIHNNNYIYYLYRKTDQMGVLHPYRIEIAQYDLEHTIVFAQDIGYDYSNINICLYYNDIIIYETNVTYNKIYLYRYDNINNTFTQLSMQTLPFMFNDDYDLYSYDNYVFITPKGSYNIIYVYNIINYEYFTIQELNEFIVVKNSANENIFIYDNFLNININHKLYTFVDDYKFIVSGLNKYTNKYDIYICQLNINTKSISILDIINTDYNYITHIKYNSINNQIIVQYADINNADFKLYFGYKDNDWKFYEITTLLDTMSGQDKYFEKFYCNIYNNIFSFSGVFTDSYSYPRKYITKIKYYFYDNYTTTPIEYFYNFNNNVEINIEDTNQIFTFPINIFEINNTLSIKKPIVTYFISGLVTETEDDIPKQGCKIRIFNREIGELLGEDISDTDGSFYIEVSNRELVYVTCEDKDVYNALIEDRVTPQILIETITL